MNATIKSHLISFILNLSLVAVVVLLTYFLTPRTYESIFCRYLSSCGGGWVDYGPVLWAVALYTLLISLFLVTFGGLLRYWWVGVCNAPVFLLILYLALPPLVNIQNFDFFGTIYLLGVWSIYIAGGLASGLVIRKIIQKLVPGVMGKIG